jgi:hypothetical protein
VTEEKLKARLEEALRRGGPTHALPDVVAMIKAGIAQCWPNDDGIVITELWERPLCKIVNYWLIAGRLDACLAMEPQIDRWAVSEGCSVKLACGRPGWARLAPGLGWRPYGGTFWAPLTDAAERFAQRRGG